MPNPQPELGSRDLPLLHTAGFTFKDHNRSGVLEPFKDWRLSPSERAKDLVGKLGLVELAGLMVHGSLPSSGDGPLAGLGAGEAYDMDVARKHVLVGQVNAFITRLNSSARNLAAQNNAIQELAERNPWGIPVTISTDPRHHFEELMGASTTGRAFSRWPEPIGFGAIGAAETVRRFADIVRQEYLAVGIRASLAPVADLATEPRWARIAEGFGEDAETVKRLVAAYVEGIQGGRDGLTNQSVQCVVKHWAGYGAAKDGWDSHNYYGRFATFPGGAFEQHLIPFTGAFECNVAAVMPTYSILEGVTLEGEPLEAVGAGFSKQMLQHLLRGRFGFKGAIISDWDITRGISEAGRFGADRDGGATPADLGTPWGVEHLSEIERIAKAINAGIDQIGGTERSDLVREAVEQGLISIERIREACEKLLEQKFALGLFEQPYADEGAADSLTATPEFRREGREAQARSVVLLKNEDEVLPIRGAGQRVYLFGISAEAAVRAGLRVAATPDEADLALLKAPPAFQSEHLNFFFGAMQHEGRLHYVPEDEAFGMLQRVGPNLPTVFVTTLERPLILTNVLPLAKAVLGTFGIEDDVLLEVLTGKRSPEGRLPFELPSSEEAVREQFSDLPHDSKDPLFAFGYGGGY